MQKKSIDIIGGGLSGCVFALRGLERGVDLRVFEPDHRRAATQAAAGIINPVTGMRFSRSWNMDEFLPSATQFFVEWGERWDVVLWHKLPMIRLFRSPELRDGFFKRRSLGQLEPYAIRLIEPGEDVGPVENLYGGVWIDGGGWVDLPLFLERARAHLEKEGRWIPERREPMGILADSHVVVDCRGYVADDPVWPFIPWKPAKGEVLTLQMAGIPQDRILNRAQFIQPLRQGVCRFGATYEWHDLSPTPSREGCRELLEACDEWVNSSGREILDHRAGIRPIVRDQKPVLGRHPEYSRLHIFNGMGSKGASWVPLLADSLLGFIQDGTAFSPVVDVVRFCE